MALWQWSTTPANNASAGLIDWAEGQPPSTVNDSARQMMADVATWFQAPEWLNYGLTPTLVSGTQFTTPNNETGIYTVGRRVRAFVSAGTIFGTITASVFTSLTTVTVAWDSGALDSGVSEVDVGILNPAVSSIPSANSFVISGPAGTNRAILMQTAGSNRWFAGADGVPETGSGAGSNYEIISCTDGGVLGQSALTIVRANNNAFFTGVVTAPNFTCTSDERLKKDWLGLHEDFVERLAGVMSGTYAQNDREGRSVGVGAQSLRALLPEAVHEDDKGVLSVAYGQAALAACVELSKEVMRLRALLEPVK